MAKGDLLARLQGGASHDDILATAPVSVAAALMRSFTAEDYAVANESGNDPPLEFLPGLIPIGDGRYALGDTERKTVLANQSPATLATIATQLYPRFEARNDALGAVTLQLFANPSAALATWKALYAEADLRFDIPACSMLLEILRARAPVLSPELRETSLRYDEYLRARTLFADDYYRSASYLVRDELTTAFQAFWTHPTDWVLRLYGKGGSGKTMFVRWLIARHCIPRGEGREPIAVARIDFDFLNINAFAARPWLTLLPLARQLSPQFPNNPFDSLVMSFKDLVPLLNSPDPLSPTQAAAVDARAASVEAMFRAGIGAHPVLLVFDTCEEPLIHRREAFTSLLTLLTSIRTGCPRLRLLLSGRYDISGLPGASATAVGRFTPAESVRFLSELRHLPAGPLTSAIAKKSKGNPFSLGLFAELYESPGGLSVKEVREAPPDDFIYLLDRVILRIPDEAVRWLVRYAVVPRELTSDFAAAVLSPLLDDTSRDDANTFPADLAKRYAARRPWPPGRFGQWQTLWNDLLRYASNPSWISYNEASQTIQLQPEVVGPMRRLLRQNARLHSLLQRAAEKYWRVRAKANPAEFVRCRIEAVFHSFQRQGAPAGAAWHKLEAHPRFGSTESRGLLGALILTNDFLDDTGRPLTHTRGVPIVSPDVVARARFLVAVEAISNSIRRGRDSTAAANQISKLAEHWLGLSKPSVHAHLGAAEWSLVHQAHGIIVRRRFLRPTVLRALRLPKPLQLLARMLALRASYERIFLGLPTDARDVAPALALSKELRSTEFPAGHILYRAALFHLRTGNLQKAISTFVEALWELPATGPFSRDRVQCFWRAAVLLRATGRWREWHALTQAVEQRIPDSDPDAGAFRFQYWLSRAALAIDLGEADAAEGFLKAAPATTGYEHAMAAWHDLQIELATLRVDLATAAPQATEATRLYGAATNGAMRTTLLLARFWLAAGNPAQARRVLPRPPKDPLLPLECAELAVQLGRPLQTLAGPAPIRARLFATALAHGRMKNPDRFFDELRGLSSDERLAALVPFGQTSRRLPNGSRWHRRIRSAFPRDPESITGAIAVVQTIALANACRFFGLDERAGKLLALIGPRAELVEVWRQRAIRALSPRQSVPPDAPVPHFPHCPALEAISDLERTEWLIADGELARAASTLPASAPLPPGAWLARHHLAQAHLYPDDAATHLRAASEAANEAGSKALARRATMLSRHAGGPAIDRRPLIAPVDEWTFSFAASGRTFSLAFQLVSRGGGRFQHTGPRWFHNDIHALLEIRDWPKRIHELATIATPFLQQSSGQGTRLRFESSPAAAVPWEYAAAADTGFFYRSAPVQSAERETARYLQAALVAFGEDVPITGQSTDPVFLKALASRSTGVIRAALRSGQRDVLEGLSVIEPDREWQYGMKRGYLIEGLQLQAELGATPSEFPAVLYLCGVFRLDSRGEAVLDCGDQRESQLAYRYFEPGTPIRFEELAHRLLNVPPNVIRPFVIFDAIPSSEDEAPRLGLLRNLFCMRLFESGAARAVLGFGLTRQGHARPAIATLRNAFEQHFSVGELHRALLHRLDHFAFPPALWADDPSLPASRS